MRLEEPLLKLAVVGAKLAVELSGKADYGLLVADVGLPKSACGHSSDGFVRTDNDHI